MLERNNLEYLGLKRRQGNKSCQTSLPCWRQGGLIFFVPFLKQFSTAFDFARFCLPPCGKYGGTLVRITMITLQLKNIDTGGYCVTFCVKSKNDGFESVLVPIYGGAQDTYKVVCLSELVQIVNQRHSLCWQDATLITYDTSKIK